MGSGSTGKLQDIAAGAAGFAVGGPWGAAAGVGLSRKARGKKVIGKDITGPGMPDVPDVPEFPQSNAGKDRLLKEALIARLRRDIVRGEGRKATIKTSPLGVAMRELVKKKQLMGTA